MDQIFIIKHYLSADSSFPNNELLPLLVYKNALTLDKSDEQNAICIEKLFRKNDWKPSWRDGIYDFHHYHSTAHEALGIYSDHARVQFGGPQGVILDLHREDVVIIPAGVAHRCLQAGESFMCVGAYPSGQEYNILYGDTGERENSEKEISALNLPTHDPVFGKQGPLDKWWIMHEKIKTVH